MSESVEQACAWCAGTGEVAAERNFVLSRMTHGDWRWVGHSSDAMLIAAMNGGEPTARPYDAWDLSRCIVTRRVAPAHLHERMDEILAEWSEALARKAEERGPEAHWLTPATAIRQADIDVAVVRAALAEARQGDADSSSPDPLPEPEAKALNQGTSGA